MPTRGLAGAPARTEHARPASRLRALRIATQPRVVHATEDVSRPGREVLARRGRHGLRSPSTQRQPSVSGKSRRPRPRRPTLPDTGHTMRIAQTAPVTAAVERGLNYRRADRLGPA